MSESQEEDVLPARAVLTVFGGVLAAIVALSLVAYGLLKLRESQLRPSRQFTERELPAPHRVSEIRQEPFVAVPPRPTTDPALQSYGWVDRSRGLVRIPIEPAMELVAHGFSP
jgi:hypothetical protein